MLDKLLSLWHPKDSLSRLHDVIICVSDILEHFEEDKLIEGGNSKNAAIDCLIQLLQSKKDPIPVPSQPIEKLASSPATPSN